MKTALDPIEIVKRYQAVDEPIIRGTIQEIEKQFPDEYLAILVTKVDEFDQAMEGILLYHCPDRRELSQRVQSIFEPLDLLIVTRYSTEDPAGLVSGRCEFRLR